MKNIFKEISIKAMNIGGKTMLKTKQYSPEILLGVGIVSLVGAGVMAAKATLKVEEIIDEHQEKIDKIEEVASHPEEYTDANEQLLYSEEDYKRDKLVTYVQTSWNFVRVYGPAVTLAGFGVVCILSGHNILKKRNIALSAAYKAVETAFSDYRRRVIEDVGVEKDDEYRYGTKREKITETSMDENGKETKVVRDRVTVDPNATSMYARFFDSSCREWEKSPEYNLMFLKTKQSYFNDLLKIRGNVFLNEVYDDLGIPRTEAGAVTGWVISEDGDNFIDFGLYNPCNIDFVNGYEATALLDFNVQGVIYSLI